MISFFMLCLSCFKLSFSTKILIAAAELLWGSIMFPRRPRFLPKKDSKRSSDIDTGTFNLWEEGELKFGILGALLDFIKGYFPLVFFVETGLVRGYWIIPVAIAPVLGHSFSPFMGLRGGKTVAVTLGVWSAVTRFKVSFLLVLILGVEHVLIRMYKNGNAITKEESDFIAVYGSALLTGALLLFETPYSIVYLCLMNFIIMLFKYRKSLHVFFKRLGKTHCN